MRNERSIPPAPRNYTPVRLSSDEFSYFVDQLKGQGKRKHYYSQICISTSSLLQVAKTCPNVRSLDLSYTTMMSDCRIQETGEYTSTLVTSPGWTSVDISVEKAIQTLCSSWKDLEEVNLQGCEWATAEVIFMFAYYCPNLKRLDARRAKNCIVWRFVQCVLDLHTNPPMTPPDFVYNGKRYTIVKNR
jgi:hypothetical protein